MVGVHVTLPFLIVLGWTQVHGKASQPNILLVVADDYGWHDVGYHGSEIRTPTLDKLAAQGVKLENYYVQPICTPSRSQLLTGRYQIHTGLQHSVIHPSQPFGLPLEFTTIAEKLRDVGYKNHIVGKWHLGYFKEEYLPTNRGFDSHFGYLNGVEDYFNHSLCYAGDFDAAFPRFCGTDLRNNTEVVWNNTEYSAHLFARVASKVIAEHNQDKPLFLYLPFQSVHSPLEVPKHYEDMYSFIKDNNRRKYAGMVTCMDEAIANVTAAFQKYGLWDNTLLIFSTDNGGKVTAGGSNWPLRGWKDTLWEGGVHGVGFVHGQMLQQRGVESKELIHISDWFPTLLHLAGGTTNSTKLDGYNMWDTISKGAESPRKELLHNIDPLYAPVGDQLYPDSFDNRYRAAIRSNNWKLITGNPNALGVAPSADSRVSSANPREDSQKNIWLFDIESDPNEHKDVSDKNPQIVRYLLDRLQDYNKTSVPVIFPPPDTQANPKLHRGAWGPWRK